ncbi:hypothetical protein RJ641_008791, partial [Dillenia turbinata]
MWGPCRREWQAAETIQYGESHLESSSLQGRVMEDPTISESRLGFIPSFISLLIYSSPIIICTAILLRILFTVDNSKVHDKIEDEGTGISQKKSECVESDSVVGRERRSLRPARSRRRIFPEHREENGRWSTKEMVVTTSSNDDLSSNVGDAEKVKIHDMPNPFREMVFATTSNDALLSNVGDTEKVKIHDTSNAIPYSKCSRSVLETQGAERGDEKSESSVEEDEDAPAERNNAAQWTEDDQKNLMDLGTSEIERNRRLESLMAKRKARKFLRMHAEKNLIDYERNNPSDQIAPILIFKNNPFHRGDNSVLPEGLQTPGSAPSILLPMRNPFDLPYEPYEEKPNLMGDSFQQEFMAAQHKDFHFCRHESFSLGPSFKGDYGQERRQSKFCPFFISEQRPFDRSKMSRFQGPSSDMGDQEKISGEDAFREHHCCIGSSCIHFDHGDQSSEQIVNLANVNHKSSRKTDREIPGAENDDTSDGDSGISDRMELYMRPDDNDDSDGSSSSSSSEENGKLFTATKPFVSGNFEPKLGNFPGMFSSSAPSSLSGRLSKTLSVEVGNNGPTNESLLDSSPSAIDKRRAEDPFFFTDNGTTHTPSFSIASDLQVEVSEIGSPPTVDGANSPTERESFMPEEDMDRGVTCYPGSEESFGASSHLGGVEENESRSGAVHEISEQDIIEVGFVAVIKKFDGPLPPAQVTDEHIEQVSSDLTLSSSPQAKLTHFDHNTLTKGQVVEHGTGKPKSSDSSDASTPEASEVCILFQRIDGSWILFFSDTFEPVDEAVINENINRSVVDADYDEGSSKLLTEMETKNPANQDGAHIPPEEPCETTSKSYEIEDKNGKPIENENISEPLEPVQRNYPKPVDDFGKESDDQGLGNESMSRDSGKLDNLEYLENETDKRVNIETRHSVSDNIINDHVASAARRELVAEEVPVGLSSPSSSKSEHKEKVVGDQISSYISQEAHLNVPTADLFGTVEKGSQEKNSDESLSEIDPVLSTVQSVSAFEEVPVGLNSLSSSNFKVGEKVSGDQSSSGLSQEAHETVSIADLSGTGEKISGIQNQNLTQQGHNSGKLDNLEYLENETDKRVNIETRHSVSDNSINDPVASAAQQELVAEEVPVGLSSPSSSKSKHEEKVAGDQIPSCISQEAHLNVPTADSFGTVEKGSEEKNSDESLSEIDPVFSTVQRDSAVEEVPVGLNSSSSSKFEVGEKVSGDQSLSGFSQEAHENVSIADLSGKGEKISGIQNQNPTQHGHNSGKLDNLEYLENETDKRVNIETRHSVSDDSINEPIASAAQRELVAEEVPVGLSSPSSSKSEHKEKVAGDQIPSCISQEAHLNVPTADLFGTVEKGSEEKNSDESLSEIDPIFSTVQRDSPIEEVPVGLNSLSSSNFEVGEKVSGDQSSSGFSQEAHENVSTADLSGKGEKISGIQNLNLTQHGHNSPEEGHISLSGIPILPSETSGFTAVDHSFNGGDKEKPEEASSLQEKYSSKADTIHSLNALVDMKYHGMTMEDGESKTREDAASESTIHAEVTSLSQGVLAEEAQVSRNDNETQAVTGEVKEADLGQVTIENGADAELSQTAKATDSQSVEDIEGDSVKLAENEGWNSSAQVEGNDDSGANNNETEDFRKQDDLNHILYPNKDSFKTSYVGHSEGDMQFMIARPGTDVQTIWFYILANPGKRELQKALPFKIE